MGFTGQALLPWEPPITGNMHPAAGTHKCRYVALLLYLWVSFGPGVGVKRLVGANRRRALGVGVEVVEPKAIAGEQPELGVCRFD